MPLSETEYKYFFGTLTARQVLRAICVRRAILGCYDPAIQALDRYENHGIIPDGKAKHTSQAGKAVMGGGR